MGSIRNIWIKYVIPFTIILIIVVMVYINKENRSCNLTRDNIANSISSLVGFNIDPYYLNVYDSVNLNCLLIDYTDVYDSDSLKWFFLISCNDQKIVRAGQPSFIKEFNKSYNYRLKDLIDLENFNDYIKLTEIVDTNKIKTEYLNILFFKMKFKIINSLNDLIFIQNQKKGILQLVFKNSNIDFNTGYIVWVDGYGIYKFNFYFNKDGLINKVNQEVLAGYKIVKHN